MINELDCVRLTEPVTGRDMFSDGIITVPAGAEGCAILARKDACQVEFTDVVDGPDGKVLSWSTTSLVIPTSKLIKYWDVATQQYVV